MKLDDSFDKPYKNRDIKVSPSRSPINKHMLRYDGNDSQDELIDENIFEQQTNMLGQN